MVRTRSACSPQQVEAMDRLLDEVDSLANALLIERQAALQLLLIDRLDQVRQAVIAPPRSAVNAKEVLVIVVTVVTAGTPVQGPAIQIAPGYLTTIRQSRHTGVTRTGYVAFERSDTANSLNRMQFRDNDSIALPLAHLDSLWFDADNGATSFELIVPYGRRPET